MEIMRGVGREYIYRVSALSDMRFTLTSRSRGFDGAGEHPVVLRRSPLIHNQSTTSTTSIVLPAGTSPSSHRWKKPAEAGASTRRWSFSERPRR